MATKFCERIYSPLSANEARAVVDEVDALIDALVEDRADGEEAEDSGIDGFSVVPEHGERDADGYAAVDVFDDVSLEVVEALPPTAAEARAIAHASGYMPSSFVFEPAALERLPSCRSTIVLEYYARVSEKRQFVALEKLVFARVGKAVVSSGEGTRLKTVEATIEECARALGAMWAKTAPLGSTREKRKKPRKTRPAKPGELEALGVQQHLARIIEGKDPLAREALKRQLERTTDAVRSYAAALMEDGPRPDASVAKELSWRLAEVVTSREELSALLKSIK